jgi:hypothetical protein
MSNIRNSQLLQRVQAHPLRSSLAKALDIAEAFAGDVQFLQLDKNLSPQGRDNARRTKLRAAIRDLRDARAPVDEMQKKLDAKRAVPLRFRRSIPRTSSAAQARAKGGNARDGSSALALLGARVIDGAWQVRGAGRSAWWR